MLICVDGMDGAGKTTFCNQLASEISLNFEQCEVSIESEPTQGSFGRKAREAIRMENPDNSTILQLILKDREQHVANSLSAVAKCKNKIVLLDRYYYSTVCYQSDENSPPKKIAELQNAFVKPNVSFILLLDPALALLRIESRGTPLDGYETIKHLRRSRKIFTQMTKFFPIDNIVLLDASLPVSLNIERALKWIPKISSE